MAWGIGLTTVVGVALAGGGVAGEAGISEPGPTAGAAASDALSPEARPATVPRSVDPASGPVVITWPPAANQVITGSELVVRGHVLEPWWRVQVVLQSRSAEPIVVRTGGPMTKPGGRDRSPGRTFVITLPLPDPRPSGPAVLQVVAFDASGRAQDVVLRPIQIGSLLGPAAGADTGRMVRCHLPDVIRGQRRIELAAPGC